jgi:hypothetical protein
MEPQNLYLFFVLACFAILCVTVPRLIKAHRNDFSIHDGRVKYSELSKSEFNLLYWLSVVCFLAFVVFFVLTIINLE